MTAAEIGAAAGIPEQRGRREVRAAREAHRGPRRARERSRRHRRRAAARGAGDRPGARSGWSCTTARAGRTTPCGRRRRGSRTGSAAPTPTRWSTTTSRWARRWRCDWPARYLVAEPELRSALVVAACRESYLLDYANAALAVHVQLRRRRRRRAPDDRFRAEPAPRLARDHRRVVRAPGEGARGRERRAGVARDRRRPAPLPRRRRSVRA